MNRLPISDSWTQQTRQVSSQSNDSIGEAIATAAPHAFFLPVRYEPNYAYPLVVWLHDDGSDERQVSAVMPHLSRQNYVAVGVRGTRAVDAAGRGFDWLESPGGCGRAEQAVLEAVEATQQRYAIHAQRVFVAGYRGGGTMAQRIALRHPDRFAGAISLGGAFPRGARSLANLHAARRLPLLMGMAMEGGRFDPARMREDLHLISAAKLSLELQQYTCEDEMMVEVLRRVDRWIMDIVSGRALGKYLPVCETDPVEFSAN